MREMTYEYKITEEKVGELELQSRKYLNRHPYFGLLIMSVGLPVVSIAAIFFSTAAVMLPLSCMLGWI